MHCVLLSGSKSMRIKNIHDRGDCHMEIRRLEKQAYAGQKFTAHYQTTGYYDICVSESGFQLNYIPFEASTERSFDDVFSARGWRTRLRSARLRAET